MHKLKLIARTAKKMNLVQLKIEAQAVADKLSNVPKENRQSPQYKEGMLAWKILRREINCRKEA